MLGEHESGCQNKRAVSGRREARVTLADVKTISVVKSSPPPSVRGVSERACIIKRRMRRGRRGKKGDSKRAEEFGMDWGVGVIIKKG